MNKRNKRIYYATDSLMPTNTNVVGALVLFIGSIWIMHPDNKDRFVSDSQKHGLEAQWLFYASFLDHNYYARAIGWLGG